MTKIYTYKNSESITSKERVLKAFHRLPGEPDLQNSAKEIRTRMGSDCIVVGGTIDSGFVPEVVKCPLEDALSLADITSFAMPGAYAPGRYKKAKRDIKRFGKDYFIIGDVELSLFELAWHRSQVNYGQICR